MKALWTPLTILAYALLAAFFAVLGYLGAALEIFQYITGSVPPGTHQPSLFNAIMTAVMASLFAAAWLFLLRKRRRLLHEVKHIQGFPVTPVERI